MSTAVTTPPLAALELTESISLLEAAHAPSVTRPDGSTIELGYDANGDLKEGGVFDAQGRVPLHIIRPGVGRGRGRHLYEADMLSEHADVFTGWRMYVDHRSPEAKKAAGGLPRGVRDLGGRVQEAWWDASVPANPTTGHGQGAVVGMVRPVKFMRELIDDDPALVEASIAASAKSVRPVQHAGERVWLVEGINPRGSVDWVTEAGAGGRVAPMLQEAYADDEDIEAALAEAEFDSELVEARSKTTPSDDDGDVDPKVAALMKKGMPRAMAEKAASKQLSESNNDPKGGDVAEITPEAIAEALAASPDLLVEALVKSPAAQVFIASLVEAKIGETRDEILAESRADVERAFELSEFEREAHRLIAESKLPESWQSDLRERFSIVESEPTDELNVIAEKAEDGTTVTKPAQVVLREAVTAAIEHERERLREANPTRVRPTAVALAEAKSTSEGGDDKDGGKPKGPTPYWEQILEAAGVEDPAAAYELSGS